MRHPIHLGVLNNKSEQRKNLICRYISKVHYVESANYVCASEGQRLWYFPNSSVLSVRKAWETRGIPQLTNLDGFFKSHVVRMLVQIFPVQMDVKNPNIFAWFKIYGHESATLRKQSATLLLFIRQEFYIPTSTTIYPLVPNRQFLSFYPVLSHPKLHPTHYHVHI